VPNQRSTKHFEAAFIARTIIQPISSMMQAVGNKGYVHSEEATEASKPGSERTGRAGTKPSGRGCEVRMSSAAPAT